MGTHTKSGTTSRNRSASLLIRYPRSSVTPDHCGPPCQRPVSPITTLLRFHTLTPSWVCLPSLPPLLRGGTLYCPARAQTVLAVWDHSTKSRERCWRTTRACVGSVPWYGLWP